MAGSAEFRFGHIEHEALLGCQGSHGVRGESGRREEGGCPYTEVPEQPRRKRPPRKTGRILRLSC